MNKPASWVIVNKLTGEAVLETFSQLVADKVNPTKYHAVPIMEYLQTINQRIKQGA